MTNFASAFSYLVFKSPYKNTLQLKVKESWTLKLNSTEFKASLLNNQFKVCPSVPFPEPGIPEIKTSLVFSQSSKIVNDFFFYCNDC